MKLIPRVRLAAGLPPLVTPTTQIVGAQAVNCALDIKKREADVYEQVDSSSAWSRANTDKTPVEDRSRIPLQDLRRPRGDALRYVEVQDAAESRAHEAGGVKLAANEKEVLLLELFPMVAKNSSRT